MRTPAPLLALAALVAAGGILVSCTGSGSDADAIRIGVFEPLTGSAAAGGSAEYDGIRLANKLAPTVLGKAVKLVVADNQSDIAGAVKAASQLAQSEKVSAVIGSWSTALCMAGGPVFAESAVPALAATASDPLVTKSNPGYFRLNSLDRFQAAGVAGYAFATLGARKMAMIRDTTSAYAINMAAGFAEAFTQLSGNAKSIVANADYLGGDQDFADLLVRVRKSAPDAIFLPGASKDSALIIRQARAMGMNMLFLGGEQWDEQAFVDLGGAAVEGAIFASPFAADQPATKASGVFLQAFRDEYKREPGFASALAYDAYLTLIDAITRAGSADPAKIQEALASTQGFAGSAGVVTINDDRDAVRAIAFKTIKLSKFVYVAAGNP